MEFIRVLVKAKGIHAAEAEIIEVVDIAKRKAISIEDLSTHIGCRLIEVRGILRRNKIETFYYKLPLSRRGIRSCVGDKRTESLKALLRKRKKN